MKIPEKDGRQDASWDINGAEIVSTRLKTSGAARCALEAGVSRLLSASIERATLAQCRSIGSFLGLAFYGAGARRRELAVSNIGQALNLNRAQSTRIARRSAQNWGMTTCEFLRSPATSLQELEAYVSMRGVKHLEAALAQGRGAIIVTAHLGNWEMLASRLAVAFPTAGIVRPLSNPAAQNLMSGVRRANQIGLISKNAAVRPSLKWLKTNGVLIILPDRHAGPSGELLPLFGRLTRFENAPARLAILSGAPILMAHGARRGPWLRDGRIEGHICAPFRVDAATKSERPAATREGTQRVIAGLESMVRAHPDQWSWMLRRWREDDWKD